MKKLVMLCLFCLLGVLGFAQSNEAPGEETYIEEKSSAWVKVDIPVAAPVTRTVPRSNTSSSSSNSGTGTPAVRPPASGPKPSATFDKTNKQVGRFKKGNG